MKNFNYHSAKDSKEATKLSSSNPSLTNQKGDITFSISFFCYS